MANVLDNINLKNSVTVGDVDGGMVIRPWQANSSFNMIGTAYMSGNEYVLLTDGTNTFLSGGANGYVSIRGGANDSSPSLYVNNSYAYVDNGNFGVGFTTPQHRLVVNGNIAIDGLSGGYKINDITILDTSSTYTRLYNPEGAIGLYIGDSGDRSNYYDNNYHYFRTANGSSTLGVWNGTGLGIGTTNPAVPLHVVGSGRFTGSYLDVGHGIGTNEVAFTLGQSRTANGYAYIDLVGDTTYTDFGLRIIRGNGGPNSYSDISHRGTEDLRITTMDAADIKLRTSGTERVAITSGGNVGIGDPSPGHRLTIKSDTLANAGGNLVLDRGSDRSTHQNYLIFESDSYSDEMYIGLGANSSDAIIGARHADLIFKTGSYVERMRIGSTGNVGIGTTNPTTKLWVEGSGSTLATFNSTGTNNWTIWRENGTVRGYIGVGDNGALFTGATTDSFSVRSEADLHLGGGGNNLQMTLDGSGVGIGTTTPNANLHVYSSGNGEIEVERASGALINLQAQSAVGVIGTDSNHPLYLKTNAGTRVAINTNGRVGIGTTSPSQLLDVSGIGIFGGTYRASLDGNSAGAYLRFGVDADIDSLGTIGTYGSAMMYETAQSSGHIFKTGAGLNGTERLRINSSGDVGIGTNSPTERLQVAGNIRAEAFGAEGSTFTRVYAPQGATYNGASSNTGMLTIILPQIGLNTMLKMTIRVFDYANNESFDVYVAGYLYGNPNTYWTRCQAHILCDPQMDRNFTVRFGSDSNGKGCVFIGETTSTWSYVKFGIVDAQFSHSQTSLANWIDGYNATVLNDLTGYTVYTSVSNTQATNWKRNGQNLYYGSGTGNVGIGHTSPNRKLSVAGAIELTSADTTLHTAHAAIRRGASGEMFLDAPGDITVTIDTNNNNTDRVFNVRKDTGTELFRIQENGNVGIGTSDPTAFVQIARAETHTSGNITIGDSFLDLYNTWNSDTDEKGSILTFSDSYYDSNGQQRTTRAAIKGGTDTAGNSANGFLAFYTDSLAANSASEKMRINYQGNVGINTTSPSTKLHVAGTAVVNGTYRGGSLQVNDYNSNIDGARIYGYSNNEILSLISRYDQADGGLFFKRGNNGSEATIGEINWVSNQLRLNATVGSLAIQTGNSTAITVDSSQRVGIGTTSPTEQFNVVGKTQIEVSQDNVWMDLINSSESAFRLRSYNNGTNEGTAAYAFKHGLYYSNTENAAVTFWRGGSSTGGFLTFTTNNGAERMRIDNNGNVGIGTTAPNGSRFHVHQPTNLGGTANNTLLLRSLSNTGGAGGNNLYVAEWARRDATGTDWVTWRYHNGIYVDASYQTPGTNTRVFWERDPHSAYQYFGSGSNYTLTIDGATNKVGIGTVTPYGTLHVQGPDSTADLNDWGIAAFQNQQSEGLSIGYDTDGNYAWLYSREVGVSSRGLRMNGSLYVSGYGGNVGIGTTSPSKKLEIVSNTTYDGIQISGSSIPTLGIIDTTNNAKFVAYVRDSDATIGMESNHPLTINTNNTERIRVLANGQVGIGVTSVPTGYKMQVDGSILASGHTSKFTISNIDYYNKVGQYYGAMQLAVWNYDNSTSTQSNTGTIQLGSVGPTSYQNNVIVSNGNLTVNGNGSFTGDVVAYSSSDKRLKDNVKPIENALDKVIAIGGYEFDWNDNQEVYEGHDVGVIAQEVEEVLPEVVETRKDGYKAVKYEKMVPLLIEAIKDQQKQIEELKALLNGSTK